MRMILFRCFVTLPPGNPESDDPWENRTVLFFDGTPGSHLKDNLPVSENGRRLLKELAYADYNEQTCSCRCQDGIERPLSAIDRVTAAALVLVANTERYGEDQVYELTPPLDSVPVLHALHKLPLCFRFAIQFTEYYRLTKNIERTCSVQPQFTTNVNGEELITDWDSYENACADARAEYDFTIEANGKTILINQPVDDRESDPILLTGMNGGYICPHWDYEIKATRHQLQQRYGALPALLSPVAEKPLKNVSARCGVPATARLLFDPAPRCRRFYGMWSIVHCEGKTQTIDHGSFSRRNTLETICADAFYQSRAAEGGIAINLVKGLSHGLENDPPPNDILFCITASADGIIVTDYRDAPADFIAAIDTYLL